MNRTRRQLEQMAGERVEGVRASTMCRDSYAFRITVVGVVLAVVFGGLCSWIHYLQVVRHDDLHGRARDMYTTSVTRTGDRGEIFDRKGAVLAGNQHCKDIRADLSQMPPDQRPYIIDCLVREIACDRETLERRINSGAVEVVVKNGVDTVDADRLRELKLPGMRILDSQRRVYPKDNMLGAILGFLDKDHKGGYGIEEICDDLLSPSHGRMTYEKDRRGRAIHRGDLPQKQQLNGKAVYLTIDESIQHIVESELQVMVDEFEPKQACAILANPRTGAILAMAQWPLFNPNDRSDMNPDKWRNHMVSDIYEPGSTMKSIAVAGALDYGVVGIESRFNCEEGLWFYCRRPLRDAGHHYDILTVSQIIQKSSNIGTAKIGLAMGKKRMYQIYRRFGFGETTGLGFRDESAGILRTPTNWDCLSITRFPIGQGVGVTPLQMVQGYSALANDGHMMQLRLIDRVVDADGNVETMVPQVRRLVLRESAVRDIVGALTLVTRKGGTAPKAAVPGYSVPGKTGTSQKVINGSYTGHGQYVASFIGFTPATDPAFVLLVLADAPSTGRYYGGTVAAPTFSRIAEQTLRYLGVPPDVPEEIELTATRYL